jgi:amidase
MKAPGVLLLLLMMLIPAGCGFFNGNSGTCAQFEPVFPLAEPDYNAKVERDFAPFVAALADYTPNQIVTRTALISGKSILELQQLMDSGALSSVDLTLYYLDRIQRYDIDALNAVLELNPEALAIAEVRDAERLAGSVRGPLHGIPVLLKDNIATGDQLYTGAGTIALGAWEPTRDAFLVSQLRQAGAVILGKANLSEWANYMDPCLPNGFSTAGGQTRNPYGPFDTSGSSSGSAVAAAADLVTVSVGTETQGSIISPAEHNSVVGLKPSRGLISGAYVIPLLPWQDTPGPIGRTVGDVAVLLSVLSATNPDDPATLPAAELAGSDFSRFLSPADPAAIRVGVPLYTEDAIQAMFEQSGTTDAAAQQQLRDVFNQLDAERRRTADVLRAAGFTVVEFPNTALPGRIELSQALEYGFKEAINSFLADLGSNAPFVSLEAIIAFNRQDRANRAPYGQSYLEAAQNTRISAEEYADIREQNQQTAREMIDQLLTTYNLDVVISELNQVYAPAGYPALTVPAGYGEDGTPYGMVFTGGYLAEPQLLAGGYAFERATQARQAPQLETSIDRPQIWEVIAHSE